MTAEPDPYPPSTPSSISASPGECAIDGVNVSWGTSVDIGTGVSNYSLYKDGSLLGTFSGHSYTDYDVAGGETYNYSASATDGAGNEGDQTGNASAHVPMCIGGLLLSNPRTRASNSPFARIRFFDQPTWQPSAFMRAAHSVRFVSLRAYSTLANLTDKRQLTVSLRPARLAVTPTFPETELARRKHTSTLPPARVMGSTGGER
jgi:hypothetical protein